MESKMIQLSAIILLNFGSALSQNNPFSIMRNTYNDGSHAFGYHLNDETRHVRGRINYGYSFGLRKQPSSEPIPTAADPIMPKAATNATCPTSIGYRSSCFDGSASGYGCICFVQRNMIHATAKSYCEAGGMKLLSVQTKAKQQFLLKLKQDNNIALFPDFHMWWIGGSDKAQEGHWVWPSGEPFAFYEWGIIQPDGWRWQNTMALSNANFKFYDWPLFWPAFAICELE